MIPNGQQQHIGNYERRVVLSALKWILPPTLSFGGFYYIGKSKIFMADGYGFAFMWMIIVTSLVYLAYWMHENPKQWKQH